MLDPEVIRITYDYPTSTATPMPIIFTYDKPEEVKMIKTDEDDVNTELVQGTDYTVDEDEDNCYLLGLDADGATVTVYRDTTVDQQRDFVEEGKYRIAEIEAAMDKITMQNQEQADGITRSIRTSLNTPTNFDAVLPSPNAGKAILFNDTGLGLTVSTINFNDTVAAAQAIATAAAASAAAALASQTAATASQSSASSSATAAAASAAAAALSAASTGLPALTGKSLNFLRVKADETGYEARTAVDVLNQLVNGNSIISVTDEIFVTSSSTYKKNILIKGGTLINCLFGTEYTKYYTATDIDINVETLLDTGASLQNGKDYSLFVVTNGTSLSLKVSLNNNYPNGYSSINSYKIGGFHTLCASVTSGNAPTLVDTSIWSTHPAIGYSAGDIIPNSIWCLTHRPITNIGGMVYVELLDKWVMIYKQSGTGINTSSTYAATITDTRTQIQHQWDMALIKCKLPTDNDFLVYAEGSNQKTAIAGAADPVTTGGHLDSAGKRMISGYFVEDCCGCQWEWLDEIAPVGGSAWASYGDETTRGQTYGMPYSLLAGGRWDDSSNCGSQSRNASSGRSTANAAICGRGVSAPLRFNRYRL